MKLPLRPGENVSVGEAHMSHCYESHFPCSYVQRISEDARRDCSTGSHDNVQCSTRQKNVILIFDRGHCCVWGGRGETGCEGEPRSACKGDPSAPQVKMNYGEEWERQWSTQGRDSAEWRFGRWRSIYSSQAASGTPQHPAGMISTPPRYQETLWVLFWTFVEIPNNSLIVHGPIIVWIFDEMYLWLVIGTWCISLVSFCANIEDCSDWRVLHQLFVWQSTISNDVAV